MYSMSATSRQRTVGDPTVLSGDHLVEHLFPSKLPEGPIEGTAGRNERWDAPFTPTIQSTSYSGAGALTKSS